MLVHRHAMVHGCTAKPFEGQYDPIEHVIYLSLAGVVLCAWHLQVVMAPALQHATDPLWHLD